MCIYFYFSVSSYFFLFLFILSHFSLFVFCVCRILSLTWSINIRPHSKWLALVGHIEFSYASFTSTIFPLYIFCKKSNHLKNGNSGTVFFWFVCLFMCATPCPTAVYRWYMWICRNQEYPKGMKFHVGILWWILNARNFFCLIYGRWCEGAVE